MHDVIVVGARCAGSSVAMLLAQRGYKVLLVDRDTFPSDMLMSTHFIHQRGVACLGRWGLHEQISAATPAIMDMRIHIGGLALAGNPPPVDGEAAAFAPRRFLLDDILVRTATGVGAELREGCRVRSLLFDHDRVIGVQGLLPSGKRFTERAQLVIGADGPMSRVAAEVKAPEYDTQPTLAGIAWMYWDNLPAAGLELHIRDYESVFHFPTSNGHTLVGAMLSIDRFRTMRRNVEQHYLDLVDGITPELAAAIRTARRVNDKFLLGSTRNFFRKAVGPGWVLLGDAHYKKDPCTAHGISDAFCDAEYLASTIDAGFQDGGNLAQSLEDYERTCVDAAKPFYDFTCDMAKLAPPSPDMLAVYEALQGSPDDTNAFLGTISGAVSPLDFFAPENIERILNQ